MKITYFVSYVAQKTAYEERSGNVDIETSIEITDIEHIRALENALQHKCKFLSVSVLNFIELKREEGEPDE